MATQDGPNLHEPGPRAEPIRNVWMLLVSAIAVAVAIVVPIRLVTTDGAPPLSGGWATLVTIFFGADLLWKWQRPRHASARWLSEDRVADVLATLPLGLAFPPLALLRLLKLVSVATSLRGLRHNARVHPTALRFGMFGIGLSVSAHWLACGWLGL